MGQMSKSTGGKWHQKLADNKGSQSFRPEFRLLGRLLSAVKASKHRFERIHPQLAEDVLQLHDTSDNDTSTTTKTLLARDRVVAPTRETSRVMSRE
jgi:hypothetical protein